MWGITAEWVCMCCVCEPGNGERMCAVMKRSVRDMAGFYDHLAAYNLFNVLPSSLLESPRVLLMRMYKMLIFRMGKKKLN